MVIELRVVQFWSEIILVISNRSRAARSFDFENHAYDFRPNCTPLSSTTIIYYVKRILKALRFFASHFLGLIINRFVLAFF